MIQRRGRKAGQRHLAVNSFPRRFLECEISEQNYCLGRWWASGPAVVPVGRYLQPEGAESPGTLMKRWTRKSGSVGRVLPLAGFLMSGSRKEGRQRETQTDAARAEVPLALAVVPK